MYAHPGKKLMFMGSEFGQRHEWNHDASLDWHLLDDPLHAGLQRYVQDLNSAYAAEPALHEVDFDPAGFQWIDCNDNENSVVSLIRRSRRSGGDDADEFMVVVLNFTPVPRHGYRIGVPQEGSYVEVINSDAAAYGGSDLGNSGSVATESTASHGYDQSLSLLLPPLSFLLLKPREKL
jgi:1,4-alpha-glucan branching enzyme